MKHEMTVNWKDGHVFETTIMDHTVTVDGIPQEGSTGAGPTPKPLLLMSLAGCTGIDVVNILKKMRVVFDQLQIQVTGTTAETHPMYYKQIRVEYIFRGKELDPSKLEKAVQLSENQYCGVRSSLRSDIVFETIITIL